MIDGGLRKLLRDNVRGDWQSVETEGTGRGIPDANYCIEGSEGWIECKKADAWAVTLRPEQCAWLMRRARNGGRVFIGVRQLHNGCDKLWLLDGSVAGEIKRSGLTKNGFTPPWVLYIEDGGPSNWDWEHVRKLLMCWRPAMGQATNV